MRSMVHFNVKPYRVQNLAKIMGDYGPTSHLRIVLVSNVLVSNVLVSNVLVSKAVPWDT